MSRFPTLTDKIKTDASIMMIKAVVNDSLLGREFTESENEGAGWSPYGAIRETILKCSPREYDQAIHPFVELEPKELESLYKTHFHTSTKQEALENTERANSSPKKSQTAFICTQMVPFFELNEEEEVQLLSQEHLRTKPNKPSLTPSK